MKQSGMGELLSQTRERLERQLRTQAEHIQKLEKNLQDLAGEQRELEEAVGRELEALGSVQPPPGSSLKELLESVCKLNAATSADQVSDILAEEAEHIGVRCAVFDIRGKAAWGSVSKGCGVSERALRALAVPLKQDNVFRKVYETGDAVDTNPGGLSKNRNVLEAFKPSRESQVLLLPIRSAGSVSAIFYCDSGDASSFPVEALKILSEFASAQLDRLLALSEGAERQAEARTEEAPEAEVAVPSADAGERTPAVQEEPVSPPPAAEPAEAPVAADAAPAAESAPAPAPEPEPVPQPAPAAAEEAAPQQPAQPEAVGFSLDQLSEADQKVHKDAKRFARLLISEIELYNKTKVAAGKDNKDLYRRLKSDIDRSRQTYQKRFGSTVAKQVDYFHEELVRTLAQSDASLLGAEYPGPSA